MPAPLAAAPGLMELRAAQGVSEPAMGETGKIGKYQIAEVIGSGGFATVYRAVDDRLGRQVALKVLRPELLSDPLFVRRFYQEARTIATLRHPHIVTVFEVSEAEGRLYIAMDLARGSLAGQLEAHGPFPWPEAMALLSDTARALDYAHANGVIHRDLKPANILLDSFGEALISDFGVASLLHAEPRGDGDINDTVARDTVIGTPAYIAPEIWNGEPATPATDIYALGAIAYELISGRQLFPAPSKLDALSAHAGGPQFAPGWAGAPAEEAERVLRRALNRDPAGRYATATELWRELKAADPQATREMAVGGAPLPLPVEPPEPVAPEPVTVLVPAQPAAAAPQTIAARVASLSGRPGCTLVVTLAVLLALGGLGGFAVFGGARGQSAGTAISAGPSAPAGAEATSAAVAAATGERITQITAEAAFNAGQVSIVQTITVEAGVTQTADAAAQITASAIAAVETAAAEAATSTTEAPSATSPPATEAPSATSPPATEAPSLTRAPATTAPTRAPQPSRTPAPPASATAVAQQPGGAFLGGGSGDYFTARVDGPVSDGTGSGTCIIGTVKKNNGGVFGSFDVQVSDGRETRRASTSGSGEYSICGLGGGNWGIAVYAYDGFDVPSSEEAKHQVRLRASGVAGEVFYVHFVARPGIVEPTAVPTPIPSPTPFARYDGFWEGQLSGITGDTAFSGSFKFRISGGQVIATGSSGASCFWEDRGIGVSVSDAGFTIGKRVAGAEQIYYDVSATFSSETSASGKLYADNGGGAPCIRDATWTARRTGP